jgi:hypothetical protein
MSKRPSVAVAWSDFARDAKIYSNLLESGESIVIFYNSRPMAKVVPLKEGETVSVRVTKREGKEL